MGKLVIVRHGQSTWNKENKFTGWVDVDLAEKGIEEAKEAGAMALFSAKYGEQVKVYTIGDFSKEVCGGPHVEKTGQLGKFRIKKEGSSSAGVRRIKAVLEAGS